jgi:hypothetical protein
MRDAPASTPVAFFKADRTSLMVVSKEDMQMLRLAVSAGFARSRATAGPTAARGVAENLTSPLPQIVAVCEVGFMPKNPVWMHLYGFYQTEGSERQERTKKLGSMYGRIRIVRSTDRRTARSRYYSMTTRAFPSP